MTPMGFISTPLYDASPLAAKFRTVGSERKKKKKGKKGKKRERRERKGKGEEGEEKKPFKQRLKSYCSRSDSNWAQI